MTMLYRLLPVGFVALLSNIAYVKAEPSTPLHDQNDGNCSCSDKDILDKDCCSCTITQVAEATSAYFKEILEELVQTPLFRVYTPYPEHSGKELYDVECSIPEFQDLALQLSESQLGCAIQQCGCLETECASEHWRHQPCFVQCETDEKVREKNAANLVRTAPVNTDDRGPMQYDLIDNPEQFTGYGTLLDDKSARMIWDNLYTDRFCFTSCPAETEAESSIEKRLVYRVVSGLQASINTHIAMHYGIYTDTQEPATRANWKFARNFYFGPWKKLFDERVGQHPNRIRNMHFVFALMSRAIHRLSPHLNQVLEMGRDACAKCASQFNITRDLLQQLTVPPDHAPDECSVVLQAFDSSALFAERNTDSSALKNEFKTRFQRMGDMMTCVGCDRCKLWGTLQFHAARVAIGILINEFRRDDTDSASKRFTIPTWPDLKPNDIVALVNAMAQLSKSIDQVKKWTNIDIMPQEEL